MFEEEPVINPLGQAVFIGSLLHVTADRIYDPGNAFSWRLLRD